MNNFSEDLKKVLLAGIGAVANKKEKSKVTIEEVTKKEANIEKKPKTVSKPKKSTKNIEIRNNQKSVKNTNSKNKEKKK